MATTELSLPPLPKSEGGGAPEYISSDDSLENDSGFFDELVGQLVQIQS
jgi:hypothetical protein